MNGRRTRQNHWASIPANWDEVLAHEFDEVGREESNRTSITPQATHPPLSISCIQAFDQISFDKPQISVCFPTP